MRWQDRGQHLPGPLRSLLEFGESRNEQGLYLEPLTGSMPVQLAFDQEIPGSPQPYHPGLLGA